MPISGATQFAAVIGWPVEHSRSPAIHNAAAQAAGVDLVYGAFAVAPGDAAAAAASMRTLGIRGLSVTMPHKVDVMTALDEVTPVAAALGAVNHITNTDGHLVGNNTDGAGFVHGLQNDAGVDLDGKTVAVFGAGGAARAIIHGCVSTGASVVVVARNAERAQHAVSIANTVSVTNNVSIASARVGSAEDLATADVVVNATPLGMAHTDGEGAMPFDVAPIRHDAVVVDIVYNPLVTPLLQAGRNRGLVCVDGLSMLVGQAAAQFEEWTGVPASLVAMRDAARLGVW